MTVAVGTVGVMVGVLVLVACKAVGVLVGLPVDWE